MIRALRLSSAELEAERLPEADDGVHFSTALARAVLTEFSAPGDCVLDPFAGYGTTLAVANELGRHAVGIELLADRVALMRRRLGTAAEVLEGDARRLTEFRIDPVQLCFTSPPYMTATGHPENPLTGYRTRDADYRHYLGELADIFATAGRLLRPDGHLVVNAANIVGPDGVVTTLAWDLAQAIGAHLPFRGEIYLDWQPPLEYLTGDYCLVFGAPAPLT